MKLRRVLGFYNFRIVFIVVVCVFTVWGLGVMGLGVRARVLHGLEWNYLCWCFEEFRVLEKNRVSSLEFADFKKFMF